MNYNFKFSYSESMGDIINQIIDICGKLEAEENVTIENWNEYGIIKILKHCKL